MQALPLQVSAGLESGMVRSSPANLMLRNALSGRGPRLGDVLGDPSLPAMTLHPGGGAVDFRWRLRLDGPGGSLLQVALPDALFQSLGLTHHIRPALLQALALCEAAPCLPALQGFFEQDIDLRLEEAPHGWPETDHWSKFQLYVPSLDQRLPGRLVDRFALKLARRLGRPRPKAGSGVLLTLQVGTQLRVRAAAASSLCEGDVLLCDDPASVEAARLYVMSASRRCERRYLATVRRDDGRIEHLASQPWLHEAVLEEARGPWVRLEVVEARLRVASARCRGLAVGERLEEWSGIDWLDAPEVFLGGRCVARARRTSVAGRAGFEIRTLCSAR
jgi:hypothetical protein